MKLRIAIVFFMVLTLSNAQTTPLANQKTAVLIVGQDALEHSIGHLDGLAEIFRENGVFVYKFYFPNAHWADIKAKAMNCSFLIYTGHGFANGGFDGEFGGMYVNEFVYASTIAKEVKFKNKPLIMYFNACGSHGSSAGDPPDIGIEEAAKRTTDTALPFFMAGAGAYFATSGYGYELLEDFFGGMPLQTCFKVYSAGFNEGILRYRAITSSNALNNKYIGIAGQQTHNGRGKYYGTAFVGPMHFTINSMSQISK